MALDPDGDSEMASSVGSVSDIAGNGARTPTHNQQASSAAAAASELSPPGSQPHVSSIATMNNLRSAEIPTGSGPSKATEQFPAWKGKRAQEEYQRAMDHVIDKDFNLNEFGDPFDERDMKEPLL
ncbi:hypothetical protein N7520_001026 [Penicillium odoratum]|uniref:uncharacterized protein n=1 Tax=Penicillium odoratum TaxID=1167516 RepID=UPI002548FF07|nr:uncharacterized protein N7520_001026 [Penicillium odoratum]KAJ5777780.1 hypothetical protein N7520_001026 [Penicillium odoratum]